MSPRSTRCRRRWWGGARAARSKRGVLVEGPILGGEVRSDLLNAGMLGRVLEVARRVVAIPRNGASFMLGRAGRAVQNRGRPRAPRLGGLGRCSGVSGWQGGTGASEGISKAQRAGYNFSSHSHVRAT